MSLSNRKLLDHPPHRSQPWPVNNIPIVAIRRMSHHRVSALLVDITVCHRSLQLTIQITFYAANARHCPRNLHCKTSFIQRIRRMCLHSDNLGFPDVCCCTFCHNVDSSGMNSLCWHVTHSSTLLTDSLRKYAEQLHQDFHHKEFRRSLRLTIRRDRVFQQQSQHQLHIVINELLVGQENNAVSAQRTHPREHWWPWRNALTALSVILSQTGHAFRRLVRKWNQGNGIVTLCVPGRGQSVFNSLFLWLKLTRLHTTTVDEP